MSSSPLGFSASALGVGGVPFWEDRLFRLALHEIFRVSYGTLLVTLVLEVFCIRATIRVLKTKPKLYFQGVAMNILNHFVIAPFIFAGALRYYVMAMHGCTNDRNSKDFDPLDFDFSYCQMPNRYMSGVKCVCVLLTQAIGYYLAHKMMHRKEYYWMHRFHHQFNSVVVPSTANAVSPAEYGLAYMLPIFVGTVLFLPDLPALLAAGSIISLNNILIHTPMLHELSERLPPWCVTTSAHTEHHRVLTKHYAAPTINIDYFVEKLWGSTPTTKPESGSGAKER